MTVSFKDRVAIVTGAGRGIGRDYALGLAARGARVVVNDVGAGETSGSFRADEVVAEIVARGGEAIASHHDLTQKSAGSDMCALALGHFGRIDVLINNAGVLRRGMFGELDLDLARWTIDVHLTAVFGVTQPIWREMAKAGYGRIVLTSSAANFGMEGNSAYSAAKAAMLGLVPCLAMEGEPLGIKVNGILPFAVSPMALENPALAIPARDAAANVRYQRDIHHRSPPETVSAATLYLASEACAITGELISAVGGRFARVRRSLNQGWLASDVGGISPDDVSAHIDEIMAENGEDPMHAMTDEFRSVRNRVFALEGKDIDG
ncbi:SDR family NAD(P)-dependent oxidoreductase [Chelatococcus asaccharovorans]|uniref:SDR family NAD(P)-dependent oxidoreductase n=1 Tax=Chelatococcus asaccharovorans TaxID=28210 RepID=UPI00224C6898|nr:SDR family NAD(P)-dependent oxidoreductase [Chelatococcus asaccharovorans]CAH1655886.1 NAD(P)-dependent dehydrogenase (Short-subunit alcohol dehydrogenase family) [Chelatococcus asaccharovorans]CAH1685275.1 NAD(P)-dependent dehydrogenase (Short-subunit alcohol dehydrogenase family) [Chelatococcus asaccharovorans]